jgi:ppGpp synthetase/RelA/SpoT-type nucleotidyltranferase
VVTELNELLDAEDVALGFPVESRVKAWSSIAEKMERKGIALTTVYDLPDFIGVRVVLLFRKDLDRVKKIISDNFNLISSEDTSARLGDSEFGYHSHHYSVNIPEAWLSVPTWAGLGGFTIELQVRTLAQHIWAAASHKLQYKQEKGVPPPIRRSINRVSALLETVDLELQRVLDERESYNDGVLDKSQPLEGQDETINVDNLAATLSSVFPAKNKSDFEDYSDLLDDIDKLGVIRLKEFRDILHKHYEEVMRKEGGYVRSPPDNAKTRRPGVYFRHVGLARQALSQEFGQDALIKIWTDKLNQEKDTP